MLTTKPAISLGELCVSGSRGVRRSQLREEREREVEKQALKKIAADPHLASRRHLIGVHCFGEVLELFGVLPSYFLKQVAQEVVRNMPGILEIVNEIDVEYPPPNSN
ncbi:MAG: hypothetical protein R3C53_22730 [Pirellulaceae bacterium]